MKNSLKRRSIIALVLAGSLFGGLLKDNKGKSVKASGAGTTLRGNTPSFSSKRTKFKGYMRSAEYQRKHVRA